MLVVALHEQIIFSAADSYKREQDICDKDEKVRKKGKLHA